MNISRQIGWSNESNLLYQILKQITRLTGVLYNIKPQIANNFANDADAAVGGVEIGELYHTDGTVKIRIV